MLCSWFRVWQHLTKCVMISFSFPTCPLFYYLVGLMGQIFPNCKQKAFLFSGPTWKKSKLPLIPQGCKWLQWGWKKCLREFPLAVTREVWCLQAFVLRSMDIEWELLRYVWIFTLLNGWQWLPIPIFGTTCDCAALVPFESLLIDKILTSGWNDRPEQLHSGLSPVCNDC